MSRSGAPAHRSTRPYRRRPAAAVALFLAAATLSAGSLALATAKPVKTFHGGSSVVTALSLVPRPDKEDEYTEAWAFYAWLDGGYSAQVRFVATNLGPGENNGTVEARLTTPDGKVLRSHPNYKKDEWAHAADAFSLKMGENIAGGGPTSYLVKVVGEGFGFSLTFKNAIAPWAPRGGEVTFGDGVDAASYHLNVMAPRADVSGKVTVGGAVRVVKGTGYADHTRTTLASYKMAQSWDRFRGFTPTHSVEFLQFITPAKFGYRAVRWLLVAEGAHVVLTDFGYTLTRTDPRPDTTTSYGYKPPWGWALSATNPKGKVTGTIKATAMLVVNDWLSEMNPLERAVIKGFAKPVVYDQRCDYDFKVELTGAPAPFSVTGTTDACGSTFTNK